MEVAVITNGSPTAAANPYEMSSQSIMRAKVDAELQALRDKCTKSTIVAAEKSHFDRIAKKEADLDRRDCKNFKFEFGFCQNWCIWQCFESQYSQNNLQQRELLAFDSSKSTSQYYVQWSSILMVVFRHQSTIEEVWSSPTILVLL